MNSKKLFDLTGQVAIITGGSRGIGKAIALGFADAGADVVVASRKLPDLEEVAREVTNLGRRSMAIAAHVGKMEDIKNLVVRTLEEFGKIDILVNNAGTNPVFCPILDIEEKAWDKIFEVNLKGAFLLSQEVCKKSMKQNGGKIINIASVDGISPDPGLGAYSISKASVIMLTKVLAAEWAIHGIRVNAIAPGLIKTRFSQALWDNPGILDEALNRTPLGRIGMPDEIVGAALFLASDASKFVTGDTIIVDGGSLI